jgi:hypothetical protein
MSQCRREENAIHVIAIHAISDPEKFWSAAADLDLPQGTALHSAIPNQDGSRAVCIWESDSVGTVRDFVEGEVGDVSDNEYYEVNDKNAMGLPGASVAAGT